MVKIIHMSDLHVGARGIAGRFEALIQRLIEEKGDKPDHYAIVITGDLVDNATKSPAPYEPAKAGLQTLRDAGFQHILVAPGNHDYGTGSRGDMKFVKLFKQAFFGDPAVQYPKLDIVDGVAFICLDSMAEELNPDDARWSQGELGPLQLGRLRKLLDSQEVKACQKRVLYLHHHPIKSWALHELKDAADLETVLRQAMFDNGVSIDALLYGHNHEGRVHNGRWGIRRCYDAGSATRKPRPLIVKLLPWFRTRASTRVIKIEDGDPGSDYVLELF